MKPRKPPPEQDDLLRARLVEMIAATALVHGATVVTGNVNDFAPTGVAILDPFA